jgi:DNA mismatch repair protein MutH
MDPRAPRDEDELLRRARALAGQTVGQLARRLGRRVPADPAHGKGLAGELAEQALGATAGNLDQPDFTALGVELKTIPMDETGRVRESTYVCALDLKQVQREEWEASRVRRKLARVMWLPVEWSPGAPPAGRHYGNPTIWSPDTEQERLLRDDWIALVGRIAVGGIEEITAHMGRALQIRPKAADGSVQVEVAGPDGEPMLTVPRGFYLRAAFTEEVLWRCTGP